MATVTASSVRLEEGLLFKRGKVNKSWKQRWFVLNRDFKLNYYETRKKSLETFTVNNDRNLLGFIDLLQISKIEVSSIESITHSSIPQYISLSSCNPDKDDRSYLIHLVTANRTYKLSANNDISFIKWITCFHEFLYSGIIFESYLDKKGEVNKAFKRRYFTLNKWKHLKYYNNKERETMCGVIDLNDVNIKLTINPTDHHFISNSFIELSSPKRTYTLCAEQPHITQEWIAFLSNLDDLGDMKKRKYDVIYEDIDEKEIDRKQGQIFKEWIEAQEEIELGRQPILCIQNGIELKNIGKRHRHKTTVAHLQMLLDARTLSDNRLKGGYGNDSIEFTDEEDLYDDQSDGKPSRNGSEDLVFQDMLFDDDCD